MTQKQFVIGLIKAELEQDEAQYQSEHPEEQEDEEESDEQTEEETQDQLAAQKGQDGPEPLLEEQPADLEDTASVADDQADFPENDQTEETWEEETQEEESWDGETSNEESQDEEEEQAYQPSMGW